MAPQCSEAELWLQEREAARNLLQGDAVFILRQPGVEALKRWIQGAGELHVPRAAKHFVEVALELEHVAEVFGSGEAEAAIDLGRHFVIAHFPAQRPGEGGRHLRAREVFAGDADGSADELASPENAVGAAANVL